jgi:hypothetical protein
VGRGPEMKPRNASWPRQDRAHGVRGPASKNVYWDKQWGRDNKYYDWAVPSMMGRELERETEKRESVRWHSEWA